MSPNPSKGITCAVCTYNSPRTLVATLDSLAEQTLAPERFEVIVVDNGGDPETESVTQRAMSAHPNVPMRFVREHKVGLSHARNRGIEESKFDVIAYIDDDARAVPNWLEDLREPFDQDDQIWACGGPVHPDWECERPKWLTDSMLRGLSVVQWGDEDRWLTWPERIIGTNMAFRIETLNALGGFDAKLGRQGNNSVGMEDTVIQEHMFDQGKPTFYAADAAVFHLVPADRCTFRYFFRRSYGHGVSETRMNPQRLGYIYPARRVARAFRQYLFSPFFVKTKSIGPLRNLAGELGTFRECIRQNRLSGTDANTGTQSDA